MPNLVRVISLSIYPSGKLFFAIVPMRYILCFRPFVDWTTNVDILVVCFFKGGVVFVVVVVAVFVFILLPKSTTVVSLVMSVRLSVSVFS